MSFTCRPATPDDTAALLEVHRAAFSTELEADLVAALIDGTEPDARESWVAEVDGVIVGHVLLTAGRPDGVTDLPVMLLCPLAVAPAHQNIGVGTTLTRASLDAAQRAGAVGVLVFGDPGYYSRLGFESLLPGGPQPPFEVGAEHRSAWQTLMLTDDTSTRDTLATTPIEWAPPLMVPALWEP